MLFAKPHPCLHGSCTFRIFLVAYTEHSRSTTATTLYTHAAHQSSQTRSIGVWCLVWPPRGARDRKQEPIILDRAFPGHDMRLPILASSIVASEIYIVCILLLLLCMIDHFFRVQPNEISFPSYSSWTQKGMGEIRKGR